MISLFFIAGAYIVLYVIYVYVLLPVFFSDLSKVPNAHFTSSFSPLWILWKRYTNQENRSIHAAHVKQGDIVRLGPNELSVNCVDRGIRTIYSGGFEKWNWYPNQFDNYGVPNMFSMAKSTPHSARKRIISNVYSKSYLQSSPEMHKISQVMLFGRLLPLLHRAAKDGDPIDVLELNYASTMDFINAFIFGLRNGSNFLQDVKARRHWFKVYQSRRPYRFWTGELPTLKTLLGKIRIHVEPTWVDGATETLEKWTLARCEAARNSPTIAEDHEEDTPAIVYNQLSDSLQIQLRQNPSPHPKDLQIATEIFDHLAAGHETSGIALTYLFHELSANLSLQASLRSELLTLSPSLKYPSPSPNLDLPSPRTIDALPLLRACLMETLRLHAPIQGPQPRVTPFPPVSLADTPPLRPGVRVSAQAYSLHRNATVFPEPELWKPERWLDVSEEQKAEMGRWFWAFGSGGRMCVGNNLAMQEMKLITAAIYTNFTTHVVDDEGIEQADGYTVGPRSNKLILRFDIV